MCKYIPALQSVWRLWNFKIAFVVRMHFGNSDPIDLRIILFYSFLKHQRGFDLTKLFYFTIYNIKIIVSWSTFWRLYIHTWISPKVIWCILAEVVEQIMIFHYTKQEIIMTNKILWRKMTIIHYWDLIKGVRWKNRKNPSTPDLSRKIFLSIYVSRKRSNGISK